MPVEHLERALTEVERRELTSRFRRLESMARRSLLKAGIVSFVLCGVLGVFTVLASDAPVLVIAGFWTAMAFLFTFWTGLPGRAHGHRQSAAIAAGLAQNEGRGVRIRSTRVVEFEEIEDEGACYAFDISDGLPTGASAKAGRVIFVQGQEFYADDDFPNTDFSIVDVLGPGKVVVDTLITRDGARLEPERRIGREVKDRLTIPEHLEVIEADLAHLESVLRPR
jgi:hypothetical protein